MKKAYMRKDLNEDGNYDMEDYSVVNIDSSVSNLILDKASKKHIPVSILEPYNKPLDSAISGVYSLFNGLFVSTFVVLLIRMIIMSFRSGGNNPFSSSMGPMNPMG